VAEVLQVCSTLIHRLVCLFRLLYNSVVCCCSDVSTPSLEKAKQNILCHNFVKFAPTLIIFVTKRANSLIYMRCTVFEKPLLINGDPYNNVYFWKTKIMAKDIQRYFEPFCHDTGL